MDSNTSCPRPSTNPSTAQGFC
nr:hypothetical protein CTRU02_15543 [Colletotrichum truncatum]